MHMIYERISDPAPAGLSLPDVFGAFEYGALVYLGDGQKQTR